MAWLTKSKRYAVLALLVALTGCALPASDHDRRTVVGKLAPAATVANPTQPSGVNVFEPRSSSQAILTASPVSYQAPADIAPTPSEATGEPASIPNGVLPGPVQPVPSLVESKDERAESVVAFPQTAYASDDLSDPFNGLAELPVEQLVAEVQARNPSLQAASAAWRAAAERYPQAVSLDDPMFTSMIGPRGVGMDNGGGWMVEASQKIPWAGKRALRGSAASADADAMKGDIGDARLRLSEAARVAFHDYFLAQREIEVNTSTRRLLMQFRDIATDKYQVGQATEQDVLQADVELASLESRRTELTRDEQIAVARINTLLHRAADHPLPPPPARVSLPDSLPAAETLQKTAGESRPDLYALQARIRAEQANVALACKEYYPDVNVVAKYDGFMPQEMRPQVGVELNVPLQRGRRSAAVREASERLQQRCAEYQDRLDQVRFEVQSALSRASQSQRVVQLYEKKIVPTAQRSLDSALANYTSGKLDFLRLLDAERQVNTQREMYYQSIAEYHRRLAELERAVGGSLLDATDAR